MKTVVFSAFYVFVFLSGFSVSAQDWRFPDCRDLLVTDLSFNENRDSVYVTVYNDCDTCERHVYTGIRIYQDNDTIASNRFPTNNMNPDNNSESTYKVKVLKPFSIDNNIRIQMTSGICDSLSTDDTVLGFENTSSERVEIVLTPNPAGEFVKVLGLDENTVLDIKIYDTNAKLVKSSSRKSNQLSLHGLSNGIYHIVIESGDGIVNKRLIINRG